MRRTFCRLTPCLLAWLIIPATWCLAQVDILTGQPLDGFGGFGGKQKDVVAVSAKFTPAEGSTPAKLSITATIEPGWHIYSITQKPGGPIRTKIVLDPSPDFTVKGNFQPTKAPDSHPEPAFNNLVVEEHSGEVTWFASIELAQGVDPAKLEIKGHINAQACAKSCLPPTDYTFVAKLAASTSAPAAGAPAGQAAPLASEAAEPFVAPQAVIEGYLEPRSVAPGGSAKLVIKAKPSAGWHIYHYAERDPKQISKPTLIALQPVAGLTYERPVASEQAVQPPSNRTGQPATPHHEQPVTWTMVLHVPKDVSNGPLAITGTLGFQTCQGELSCDTPRAANFTVNLNIGEESSGATPLSFTAAKYAEAAQLAAAMPAPVASTTTSPATAQGANPPIVAMQPTYSLGMIIVFSLLGGLILNLMPCVLPVIGLKILSFVEQGGHHRDRVLALNLWYSIGLVSVFMVLASLAVFLNLGWGQQFSSTAFNVVMCGLVFIMALSFLGVWEIPIPGFVGSGKSTELAAREGASGAFFKGVLTTVLATPCSGPFLGPVFGFTLKQPPQITYLIFLCIGLGMASPYLLIGAFPRLIRFLPKPGEWMDTFKQMMAFVLLGTVVFLFTFMDRDYIVPTFAMLVGLWAGCWWIGRTTLAMDFGPRVKSWVQGGAFAALVGYFAFTYLVPQESLIKWQPFSRPTLAQLTSEGKTVMLDFTADWCLVCKQNLKFFINTEEVRDALEENGVVPMLADWTDGSSEVTEMLESLDSRAIPVLAIFPAGRPHEPIIIRDVITSRQAVVDAIKQAGPSIDKPRSTSTAMVKK